MFKVLVVDDDDSIALFMSRLLKNKFDCVVLRAENGLEALSIIEDENIEAVFLDITMPIMDGMETLKMLRKDPQYKNLPVVMMTAIADKTIVDEIMELGVFSYMLKPLMYESSYKLIKKLFDSIFESQQYATDTIDSEFDDEREKILLIDTDNEFREDFINKLENKFIIYDSDSSAKGLNIFIKERPVHVFMAEGLPLLNETVMAQKIKNLAEAFLATQKFASDEAKNKKTFVYLMKKAESKEEEISKLKNITEEEKQSFDDVLVKSTEEGIILRGLKNVIRF